MKTYNKEQMKDIYYDYINNYLTLSRIAYEYNTTTNTITRILNKIKLSYQIKNRSIVLYKTIYSTSLEAIEYIPIKDITTHQEVTRIVQTKYKDYIIDRL